MNKLRLVVTGALVCTVTVAIAAAPGTKKPASTRVVPPSTTAPSSGSDVLRSNPVKSTGPDEPIVPLEESVDRFAPVAPIEQLAPSAAGTSSAPINMDWYSINNGGAIEVASGNIKMGLSIGQNAVGEVSAGNIKMGLGFWYGASGSSAPTCACDCHADPQCDGSTDILDVTQIVNVAFRNGDPILDPNVLCSYQTTDVDCSSATDILDVTRMVNVAFRNGDPATEFCSPCAPIL
jgi:hypothetical protein